MQTQLSLIKDVVDLESCLLIQKNTFHFDLPLYEYNKLLSELDDLFVPYELLKGYKSLDAFVFNIDNNTIIVGLIENLKEMVFTTIRPKQNGLYYVKWSPEEKPIKVYLRYHPEANHGSPYYCIEHWTWGRTPLDDQEDIEIDVEKPELIQFSERVFDYNKN